jgi:hypothetical protein
MNCTCSNLGGLNVMEEMNAMLTDETRQKMSRAKLGTHLSKERKQNISDAISGDKNPNYHKPMSNDQKKKISNALTGTHHSEETKQKISRGNNGKHVMSDANKQIISDVMKNRCYTNDIRQNMSLAHVGIQAGENHPFYGQHHLEETKQKISKKRKGQCSGDKNPMWHKPPPYGAGRSKYSICKKGHNVRSSWERKFVDMLFDENISYLYEPKRFNFRGISYLPDIYIPHLDLWIEIKGWMTTKNKVQHELFRRLGYRLLVLDNPKLFEQESQKLKEKYF